MENIKPMKRPLSVSAAVLCAAAAIAAVSFAQQPPRPDAPGGGDSTIIQRFEQMLLERGDSLLAADIYLPDLPDMDGYRPRRAVSMSSVLVSPKLPGRVVVTNGFRIGRGWSITVSNGQASNWGPYPNSYLDARTLSFPVPR